VAASDYYSMQNHGWALDLGHLLVTPRLNVHARLQTSGDLLESKTYNYGYDNVNVSYGGVEL